MVLNEGAVPQSADVVFIIEAKECNKELRDNRKLDIVAEQLYKELTYHNLTNNRLHITIINTLWNINIILQVLCNNVWG